MTLQKSHLTPAQGVLSHRLRTTDRDGWAHFCMCLHIFIYIQRLFVFLDSESKLESVSKEKAAFTTASGSVNNQGLRLNNCAKWEMLQNKQTYNVFLHWEVHHRKYCSKLKCGFKATPISMARLNCKGVGNLIRWWNVCFLKKKVKGDKQCGYFGVKFLRNECMPYLDTRTYYKTLIMNAVSCFHRNRQITE